MQWTVFGFVVLTLCEPLLLDAKKVVLVMPRKIRRSHSSPLQQLFMYAKKNVHPGHHFSGQRYGYPQSSKFYRPKDLPFAKDQYPRGGDDFDQGHEGVNHVMVPHGKSITHAVSFGHGYIPYESYNQQPSVSHHHNYKSEKPKDIAHSQTANLPVGLTYGQAYLSRQADSYIGAEDYNPQNQLQDRKHDRHGPRHLVNGRALQGLSNVPAIGTQFGGVHGMFVMQPGSVVGSPGIDSGIHSGINSGTNSGLHSNINSAMNYDINPGINSGVQSSINSGINSGVHSSINSGINSGVHSSINSGINSGIQSSINPGINSGIQSSINPEITSGMHSSINAGIDSGIPSNIPSATIGGSKHGVILRDSIAFDEYNRQVAEITKKWPGSFGGNNLIPGMFGNQQQGIQQLDGLSRQYDENRFAGVGYSGGSTVTSGSNEGQNQKGYAVKEDIVDTAPHDFRMMPMRSSLIQSNIQHILNQQPAQQQIIHQQPAQQIIQQPAQQFFHQQPSQQIIHQQTAPNTLHHFLPRAHVSGNHALSNFQGLVHG